MRNERNSPFSFKITDHPELFDYKDKTSAENKIL